jgi:hypothetical protein
MKILHYALLIALGMYSHSTIAMNALKAKQDQISSLEEQGARQTEHIMRGLNETKEHWVTQYATITGKETFPSDPQTKFNQIDGLAMQGLEHQKDNLEEFKKMYPAHAQIAAIESALNDYKQAVENAKQEAQERIKATRSEKGQKQKQPALATTSSTTKKLSDEDIIKDVAQQMEAKEREIKREQNANNKWLYVATFAQDEIDRLNAAEQAGEINAQDAERKQKALAAFALTLYRHGADINNEEVKDTIQYLKKYMPKISEAVAYRFNFWRQEDSYQRASAYSKWNSLMFGAVMAIQDLEDYTDEYAQAMCKEYARQAIALDRSGLGRPAEDQLKKLKPINKYK